MDSFNDGITSIVNAVTKFFNDVVVPLWNLVIGILQWPFGLGPYAQYALEFWLVLLLTILIIIAWKYKASIDPLNDILNDAADAAEYGIQRSYKKYQTYRKKISKKNRGYKKRRNRYG